MLKNTGARRKTSKNPEMPPPKKMMVGASATSVGVRSALRTSTVAYAEVLSTRLAIMKSEELKRV